MFGYVKPCLESLDEAQKKRYRAWYCGLCQSLGDRHGFRGRMTLTYDMTFLAIFLSALYEPAEAHGQMRCLPHPKEAHDFVRTSMTDYAADMTIALAYFKALDDWQDDRSLPGGLTAQLLKKRYEAVSADYPRQCADLEKNLRALSEVEAAHSDSPDAAANCFGALMASLFVREEDYWSRTLRLFGASLGRFIYMVDATCDYDADTRKHSYNPVLLMGRQPEDMRDVLTLLPDIVATGVDALNPLEVKAGMDAFKIKKEYGDRLVLHGGINAVLWNDKDAILEEIDRKVPVLKENGGFIFSSDHSIPNSVSLENMKAIVEEVKRVGRY